MIAFISGYPKSSTFMNGNNPGMVAAYHSSSHRVLGVEVASAVVSSMFFTEKGNPGARGKSY